MGKKCVNKRIELYSAPMSPLRQRVSTFHLRKKLTDSNVPMLRVSV